MPNPASRWWAAIKAEISRRLVGSGVASLGDLERFQPHVDDEGHRWAEKHDVKRILDVTAAAALGHVEEWGRAVDAVVGSEAGGGMREDLVRAFYSYLVETAEQTPILDLYRGYLQRDHYEMLQIAVAASNLRNLGDDDGARAMIARAERRFGANARKINNLYSAGYLSSLFAFELVMRRAISGDKTARQQYPDEFSSHLRFFEEAIFVSAETLPDDLKRELSVRVGNSEGKPRRTISVWAAGEPTIQFAIDTIQDWLKSHRTYDYRVQLGTYGRALEAHFILYRPEEFHDYRPTRVDPLNLIRRRKR